MSQLVRLTRLQPELRERAPEEKESFEQWLISLEEVILTYIAKATSKDSLNFNELICEACCISSSIYIKRQFREDLLHDPLDDSEVQRLEKRMASIFKNLDNETVSRKSLDSDGSYLLWMLLTGAMLCKVNAAKASFVKHIAIIVTILQITTWEEINSILRGYMWTDAFFIRTCRTIWDEVEAPRTPKDM
jgi:hypothetical protein